MAAARSPSVPVWIIFFWLSVSVMPTRVIAPALPIRALPIMFAIVTASSLVALSPFCWAIRLFMAGSSVSSVDRWLENVATTVPPITPSLDWAATSLLMPATSSGVARMRCSITVFSFVWATEAELALSIKGCMAAPSPWMAPIALRPSVETLDSVADSRRNLSALLLAVPRAS